MGLCVGACKGGGHAVVHELHLRGAVVRAVEGQLDFEALENLEIGLDVELVGASPDGRRGLSVAGDEPSAVEGALDVAFVGEAECEVEAGGHGAVGEAFAEDVSDGGAPEREAHGAGVAVADGGVAGRHDEARGVLAEVA